MAHAIRRTFKSRRWPRRPSWSSNRSTSSSSSTSRNCCVHFLQNTAFTRTLVFARTKHGADKIVKHLDRSGIRAAAIHGNKSQSVRQRTLDAFKSNRPPVLVATDIAARGLDVDGISHVINYDLPEVAEIYVHRIGRTGRAGATGIATSFCGRDERDQLRQIERLTRRTITVEQDQPEYKREAARHDQPHEGRAKPAAGQRPGGRPPRGSRLEAAPPGSGSRVRSKRQRRQQQPAREAQPTTPSPRRRPTTRLVDRPCLR